MGDTKMYLKYDNTTLTVAVLFFFFRLNLKVSERCMILISMKLLTFIILMRKKFCRRRKNLRQIAKLIKVPSKQGFFRIAKLTCRQNFMY